MHTHTRCRELGSILGVGGMIVTILLLRVVLLQASAVEEPALPRGELNF